MEDIDSAAYTTDNDDESFLHEDDTIAEWMEDILREFRDNTAQPFAYGGPVELPITSIHVDGVGDISLPLSATGIERLKAASDKAPFGRGSKTLKDLNIRDVWQIDGSKISSVAATDIQSSTSSKTEDRGRKGKRKASAETTTTTAVKADDPFFDITAHDLACRALHKHLQVDAVSMGVKASLYKLLLYEEGGHFQRHRDSEKAPGMFATYLLELPVQDEIAHEGGTLTVWQGDKEVVIDTATMRKEDNNVNCAREVVFYADCEHELQQVSSGYRVVLAFNLIWQEIPVATDDKHSTMTLRSMEEVAATMDQPLPLHMNQFTRFIASTKRMLASWKKRITMSTANSSTNIIYKSRTRSKCAEEMKKFQRQPCQKLIALPLQHQYTSKNFSPQRLKGHDALLFRMLRDSFQGELEVSLLLRILHEQGWPADEHNLVFGYYNTKLQTDNEYQDKEEDVSDNNEITTHNKSKLHYKMDEVYKKNRTNTWLTSEGKHIHGMEIDLSRDIVQINGNDEEFPDKPGKERLGNTGNEGMSLEYWYYRAYIVIYPGACAEELELKNDVSCFVMNRLLPLLIDDNYKGRGDDLAQPHAYYVQYYKNLIKMKKKLGKQVENVEDYYAIEFQHDQQIESWYHVTNLPELKRLLAMLIQSEKVHKCKLGMFYLLAILADFAKDYQSRDQFIQLFCMKSSNQGSCKDHINEVIYLIKQLHDQAQHKYSHKGGKRKYNNAIEFLIDFQPVFRSCHLKYQTAAFPRVVRRLYALNLHEEADVIYRWVVDSFLDDEIYSKDQWILKYVTMHHLHCVDLILLHGGAEDIGKLDALFSKFIAQYPGPETIVENRNVLDVYLTELSEETARTMPDSSLLLLKEWNNRRRQALHNYLILMNKYPDMSNQTETTSKIRGDAKAQNNQYSSKHWSIDVTYLDSTFIIPWECYDCGSNGEVIQERMDAVKDFLLSPTESSCTISGFEYAEEARHLLDDHIANCVTDFCLKTKITGNPKKNQPVQLMIEKTQKHFDSVHQATICWYADLDDARNSLEEVIKERGLDVVSNNNTNSSSSSSSNTKGNATAKTKNTTTVKDDASTTAVVAAATKTSKRKATTDSKQDEKPTDKRSRKGK